MVNSFKKIGVIGAGSWGTALAFALSKNASEVLVWDRDTEVVESINSEHKNLKHFPDISLPEHIKSTKNMTDLKELELLVLVVPAQVIRPVIRQLMQIHEFDVPILICAKGIENELLSLMSDIVGEAFPKSELAVLSGPNFAKEVIISRPAATTIACKDEDIGMKIVETFTSPAFRCYYSEDLIGVQVSGAAKNVLAIAAGIVDGMALGENAKAALITRGIAEIARLVEVLGGKKETLMGLAGIGDIILTCGTQSSRNMEFGFKIGEGNNPSDVLERGNKTVEGYYTTLSIKALIDKHKLDMPICQAVYDIIHDGADIKETLNTLMKRPIRSED